MDQAEVAACDTDDSCDGLSIGEVGFIKAETGLLPSARQNECQLLDSQGAMIVGETNAAE
jgi:hypothetical protein